jgi:hypothetical protein
MGRPLASVGGVGASDNQDTNQNINAAAAIRK